MLSLSVSKCHDLQHNDNNKSGVRVRVCHVQVFCICVYMLICLKAVHNSLPFLVYVF